MKSFALLATQVSVGALRHSIIIRPTGDHSPLYDDEAEDPSILTLARYPEARSLILGVLSMTQGARLRTADIATIYPGKGMVVVGPVSRYHLIVDASPGVRMSIGDEEVAAETGQLWHWSADTEVTMFNGGTGNFVSLLMQIDPL